MGLNNIDIYESDNRVGGKSMSVIDPQGTVQDLGSCLVAPGYENNVIEIIREYLPRNSLFPTKHGSVWLDDADVPVLYMEYFMKYLMKHFGTKNQTEASLKLSGLIEKYSHLHHKMFGKYEYELMPRPSKRVLEALDCSYMTFLKRNDLDSLRPLLLVTHSMSGYGYLDEISAFYGLMWNTPILLSGMLKPTGGRL